MARRSSSYTQSQTREPGHGDGRGSQRPPAPNSDRLEQIDAALYEIRNALDVQFKRIAAMQAQLDQLVTLVARLRDSNFRS